MSLVNLLVHLRQFSLRQEVLPVLTVLILVLYILAGHLLLQTKSFWGALSGALIGLIATLYVFTLLNLFSFDLDYYVRFICNIIGLS